jgi:hypothetical protein
MYGESKSCALLSPWPILSIHKQIKLFKIELNFKEGKMPKEAITDCKKRKPN